MADNYATVFVSKRVTTTGAIAIEQSVFLVFFICNTILQYENLHYN